MPDVTVVIPTRDRADLVVEAARSCVVQEGVDVEVLVVDDGGADDTEARLAQLPVRYIRQDWAGRAAARNRGAALASAPVLAFLDSDDLSLRGRLARQLARLDRDSVGVWGQVEIVDERGEVLVDETRRIQREIAETAHRGATPERLAVRMRVYPSTLVVRRDVFDELGGFDESLFVAEDVELILRLARRGRLAFEPELVAAIRRHPGNSPSEAMFEEAVDLTEKLIRSFRSSDDRALRSRLLHYQARAHWSLGDTPHARSSSLRALREDASVVLEPGFVKRAVGSLVPQPLGNSLRRAKRRAARARLHP